MSKKSKAKNKRYWARRMKLMEDAIMDGAYKDVQNIEREYTRAIKEIDTKINAWYQRVAKNNEISFAEAQKLLAADELEEFHWTVQEYIDRGSGVISGDWAKQLENASARVHISRLDALKLEMQAHAEELTGKRILTTEGAASAAYMESYYHTAYEVQQLAGVGVTMHKVDTKRLEKVLSRPWTADNMTFKARCWTDKDKLVNLVNKELTRMVATGAKPDKAIKNIAQAFNTSKSNAARVVMTESAYFASAAQKDCYTELDVEQFEVVGTFDNRMCKDCADMDGTHAPMKEFKEGVTAPPFHPWCRCTTAPYFEDMKNVGERWMRDPETGKGDYVPADMTFDEWKDIYINKKSTMDDWEKAHYGRDVWSEYNRKKKPGIGSVEFEEGYNLKKHKTEIDFSQWLHETLGGDIVLLNDEGKPDNIKTPDYLWKGEQWELKSTSTIKSANDAIKRGLGQITSGNGGLMLNFGKNDIPSMEELKGAIDKRMHWHKKKSVDIMIVEHGRIISVFRYKK